MIKLVIVDDHKIFRDGIKALLMSIKDIDIIDEAGDGDALTNLLKQNQTSPDIIIMDIIMPNLSGIDLTRIVKRTYPEIKIIMLSSTTNEETIIEAVKSGANGYLPKDCSKDEFIKAVRSVYKGDEYFGSSISQMLLKSYFHKIKKNKAANEKNKGLSLTDREVQIIKLFADGLSYKEIGDKLFISARTVESHKNNILKKLELRTTIDLVKYAIKNKLIKL